MEYIAAVINLTTSNSTFKNKVNIYTNHLFTKEENNGSLQKAVRNLQCDVKNLKSDISMLEKSSHSGGVGRVFKDKERIEIK